MKDCLRDDSDEMNTATSQDVARALLEDPSRRLNVRMLAALDRDFYNDRRRDITFLEPAYYDAIIYALIRELRTVEHQLVVLKATMDRVPDGECPVSGVSWDEVFDEMDPELKPIIRAMVDAGMKPFSSCAGHEKGEKAWLCFRGDNVQFEAFGGVVKIKWFPTWLGKE